MKQRQTTLAEVEGEAKELPVQFWALIVALKDF
jgi:hypothetical protein